MLESTVSELGRVLRRASEDEQLHQEKSSLDAETVKTDEDSRSHQNNKKEEQENIRTGRDTKVDPR